MLKIEYPLSVILIDDDKDTLILLENFLKGEIDYKIFSFTSPKKALEHIEHHGAQIAIVDINMSEMPGQEVLEKIHKMGHGTEVIIITAEDNLINFTSCYRKKASSFIFKPIKKEIFLKEINYCHDIIKKWNTVFMDMIKRRHQIK
ncbi:MAG: response regulator [Halobacteriovoraceae bacterium]|nr:response regulator [Halobacteriovoraceae bacterium]